MLTWILSFQGYIIGLGDRHNSNILIGTHSAELVHIDLGSACSSTYPLLSFYETSSDFHLPHSPVAFEQGKLLPTPERVPFRLTRDVVDGMGADGCEGVMRRCAEETLAVLRRNKESLLTLIEVLIHDPILKWALSPAMAARVQGGNAGAPATANGGGGGGRSRRGAATAGGGVSECAPTPGGGGGGGGDDDDMEEPGATNAGGYALVGPSTAAAGGGVPSVRNADAERALLRVRQKLDGTEDGESGARPVEAQVQQLLCDARDPDNLCLLFPGWAPWV